MRHPAFGVPLISLEYGMASWRTSLKRFGFWQSVRSGLLNLVRRVFDFELCVIQHVDKDLLPPEPVNGYTCRLVDSEEFHANLCEEFRETDFRWAFERGDICLANICNGRIVGYDFSTQHPTVVTDGIEFFFPSQFAYGYAALTASDHRGRRLAPHRWYETFMERKKDGVRPVFYFNLANSPSLKSNRNITGPKTPVLGYTAYIRTSGRVICWRSPAAKALGVGFRAS